MADLTDVELINKYLDGQEGALEELISRYFRQIFLFAKSYVKEDEEAEDITQEAFVRAWKNLRKFDQSKKFKTWLFQITKNACIDLLRKRKNLLSAASIEETAMLSNLETMKDQELLPEELFDIKNLDNKLTAALGRLPEIYSKTVTLHLRHELSFQEISEILAEPLNTIKSRYRRALLMIRAELQNKS